MDEEELQGYRGRLRGELMKAGARVGDLIKIKVGDSIHEGILMPRLESADDWHLVLKLKSGYNIGVSFDEAAEIERLRAAEKPEFRPPPLPKIRGELPKVSILSTGGTIASRVDYVTGGVHAAISSRDLLSIVPELSDVAAIDANILYSVFSENISADHWSGMALKAEEVIREGAEGVVITHGTDTMGYSAAALSFALQKLPVPVILVGSQRSSDRPSSDAATNLMGAVTAAAHAPFAEVALAMHEGASDNIIAFHRGTKVRKCHTSARYAFKSVNAVPLAKLMDGEIEMLTSNFRRRCKGGVEVKNRFEKKVGLVKFYPGFDPNILRWLIEEDYKGIILEGTGLGHVSSDCYDQVKKAIREGVVVGMTSQCIWGRLNMNVYSTGRELIRLGVEPLEDMMPETALVKLMWALGEGEDREMAVELMRQNIAGEYMSRTLYTGS